MDGMVAHALDRASARVLEFESVCQLLATYASSPLGLTAIAALRPSSQTDWIIEQQQLTSEVRAFRRAGGRFDFSGLSEVRDIVENAGISGATLETGDIRAVLVLVGRGAEWREIALAPPAGIEGPWSEVPGLSSGIGDFRAFLAAFERKILPDGSLEDRASPELARIRREIERQKRVIQESLRGQLRQLSDSGLAQDELITVRGERFVIPVKVEQRRRVPGVVHGASSSGQTVYVEPLATIEQNNDLVRLFEEESAEIHRILAAMTRLIGEQAERILATSSILAELELQFAKARFAEDYHCVRAEIGQGEERVFRLRNARHPLLERSLRARGGQVVPTTIELAGSERELVITGPNTGGKTVGVKTAGLLALMAQAGIPVPAERCELPVFDAVLADIGDEQSIEQNLSTFSAHITHIDFISRIATPRSLVLLDELGSATDAEEGAALAVAIAEHFLAIGCLTIVSTHHTSLKVFAANTPGVTNASMGFDEVSLQPTYQLQMGVPGASAGLDIAQRLGLNAAIVRSARQRLTTQARDVGDFLERLHAELRQLEAERAQLRVRELEVEREKARLEAEGKKEQQAKVKELERKLESLLRDFEYHMRENLSAIAQRAQAKKLSQEAERQITKLRRSFSEQFNSTVVAHSTGADQDDPHARPQLVGQVSLGDSVQLKSIGRPARVTRRLDEEHFEVEIGAMKMKIARDDIAKVLSAIEESPVKAARRRGISVSLAHEDQTAPSEINLIGYNVDDAVGELEKFLDRAFLVGLPRVRVVHGSGMGVLRKALRQYLQKHPQVESVKEPAQNEGGAGATEVELKV
jgi:DNA mismatch repair protein MutS2